MTDSALPAGWQVRRLAPALGAEITGADLRDQSDGVIDALKALLRDHLVIFFPDQKLSVDEHVALLTMHHRRQPYRYSLTLP